MSARLRLVERLLLVVSASVPFACSSSDDAPVIANTSAGGTAGSNSAGAAGEAGVAGGAGAAGEASSGGAAGAAGTPGAAGSGGATKPPTCVGGCSGTFCYDLVGDEKCEPAGYVVHGCQMTQGGNFSPDPQNPHLDPATGISSCCYSPGCAEGRPFLVNDAARISPLQRGTGYWV